MRFRFVFSALACTANLLLGMACTSFTVPHAPADLRARNHWTARHLQSQSEQVPFSFMFDGKPSAQCLAQWPMHMQTQRLDANRTRRTRTWTDPVSGLQARCQAVEYRDYPVIEWTVFLKNTGSANTPVLENIQGLDMRLKKNGDAPFVLHTIKGDWCTPDSYEPLEYKLEAGSPQCFGPPSTGRSSESPRGWPYYNLQRPGGGIIMAIGWPGQWASRFECEPDHTVTVKAGQEKTRLYLKPGEQIRTPLIALLFWQGEDVAEAQNLWRRWYLDHNLPRTQGEPAEPLAQIQVEGSAQNIEYVKKFVAAGIRPQVCWRDAGGKNTWYPSAGGPWQGNDAWMNTGTWQVDPAKYPLGFRPFSDWVHEQGMQFLLWFEPERVGNPASWLAQQHPEWILPEASHGGAILNLGDPAALAWLIDHFDGLIKSQGIDWYREDMNGGGPYKAWVNNDVPDRLGITENLYVQGHLTLWDELRRRNSGLHIDSCAAGGRRNDLETMRRAVPFLRSDFQWPDAQGVVEGNQGHTYGLSFWLPYQGTGCYLYDPYAMRSFYLPCFGMGELTEQNAQAQRQAYTECGQIAPMMLRGDYYPLTPYSLQLDQWIGWQFNRPGQGDGVVQVFRRAQCEQPQRTLRLRGLEPAAHYEIRNLDADGVQTASGQELMDKGLTVTLEQKPAAGIYLYAKID